MIFSKFIELCNYHHNSVLEHFHHSNKIPHAHLWLISVQVQATTNLSSVSIDLPSLDILWNHKICDLLFMAFFHLTYCFEIYVVMWISISLILLLKFSVVWTHHILSIHSEGWRVNILLPLKILSSNTASKFEKRCNISEK